MRSMTGFAQREVVLDGSSLSLTVRSVNQRGFEFYLRSGFPELEMDLKQKAKILLQRGKVELTISYSQKTQAPSIDRFKQKYSEFSKALTEIGLSVNYDASALYRIYERSFEPDLLNQTGDITKEIELLFLELDRSRKKEGDAHLVELKGLIAKLTGFREVVSARAEKATEEKQSTLKARLLSLSPIDDSRVLQEIAILADKLAIGEELVRLIAHEERCLDLLKKENTPQGKELEFMSQELLREWNTIGSKSQDSVITHAVVDAKGCIEQIRELAANVV